jgi:hypothetical protein
MPAVGDTAAALARRAAGDTFCLGRREHVPFSVTAAAAAVASLWKQGIR